MQARNNNGSIIIRFTKFGYKYSLSNLGKYEDDSAIATAKNICTAIQSDIDIGKFTCKDNNELFTRYHPLANLAIAKNDSKYLHDALTSIETKLNGDKFKDRVLLPCKNLLTAYGKKVCSHDDALKFWEYLITGDTRSNNTNNLYLASMKPVCPMFADIKPLKKSKIQKTEKPFSKIEIKAIIDIFDRDYFHYSSFIKFLFMTGCRTGEAIALRWQNVDFENRTITISESIGTLKDGSKAAKTTKSDVVRVLSMSPKLYRMMYDDHQLWKMHQYSSTLVFTTAKSTMIDIANFRARVWIDALKSADVPHRTLYNTRHTFVSHFIADNTVGDAFIKCASITHGTKSGVQTLIKHYAHLTNKVELPDIW